MPPGVQQTTAIAQFFRAWAEIDPSAALRGSLKFGDAFAKQVALDATYDNVTPQSAGKLTRQLLDAPQDTISSPSRLQLLSRMLTKWSQADPLAAAQFYDEHPEAREGELLRNGGGLSYLAGHIAQNWALIDPQGAMEWATKQQDEGATMQGAIAGWWEKDPDAARAFVQKHSDIPEAKKLALVIGTKITSYSGVIAQSDPEKGLSYAATISDPAMREQAMYNILRDWLARDRIAATAWIQKSPLTNDQKSRLIGSQPSP